MSVKRFKFVSPGVFLKEIDNSQLPKLPGAIGPIVIGRTRKGPALKPVQVDSYADFVEIFGDPIPGNQGDDVWREGNGQLATAYASYAAKAYFSADITSPVTMVRLLGVKGDDAPSDSGEPGWQSENAWGMFLVPSSSMGAPFKDATLAAIFYGAGNSTSGKGFAVGLKGLGLTGSSITTIGQKTQGTVIKRNSDKTYTLILTSSVGTRNKEIKVSFHKGQNYIRDVLNTNPVATNSKVSYVTSGSLADAYWLGETFDESVKFQSLTASHAFILPLREDATISMPDRSHEMSAGASGWVFHQDFGQAADYTPKSLSTLFRVHALHEGLESSKSLIVGVEDIVIPADGSIDPYGSFTITIKRIYGNRLETIESFPGCNLNPNSPNFVSRQVGDQYFKWHTSEKRNRVYGNYPNQSRFVRIEVAPNVGAGVEDPAKVPFGFWGPVVPKTISPTAGAIEGGGHGAPVSGSFVSNGSLMKARIRTAADHHVGKFNIKWPTLPLVVSGSIRGTTVWGASPFKVSSTGDLGDSTDPGYVDYVRRGAEGIAAAQALGEPGASHQYSWFFSLDDLVLGGNTVTAGVSGLADSSTAQITASYYLSGSRRGRYGTPESTVGIVAASALLQVTGALTNAQHFTLEDSLGDKVKFTFNTGVTTVGNVIGLSGIGGGQLNAQAQKIADSVNAMTPSLAISASHDANTVKLMQLTGGVAGNTKIDVIANLQGIEFNNSVLSSHEYFMSGAAGTTTAAVPAIKSYTNQFSASVLLELGYNKFHMPLVGGFDGVDEVEADPFNNRILKGNTSTNSYAYASVERAIELIRDPEAVEHNIAVMPGVTNESLTTKLVQTCEARADSIAIIDLPDIYKPAHELKCKTFEDRLTTTPTKTSKALTKRQLNSSYGAAYYPWVKIRDAENTRDVWVPPSVIALGIFAFTEERDEVWFAPAGFNRGGLNEGNAGVPVLQVTEQLLSKQRDVLYEANINPIASFVTEGLVVFGQKTLQSTASALDRINVRRLLIFVKKEISRIASSLLFDQNVPATWSRFTGQVIPFLDSVKTRLGLSAFKVVLDETTTTPELIDRNIMYAKIFLKPARAIEFIAVDFVITNTGASFAD